MNGHKLNNYKSKYKRNYKNYDKILFDLYKNSISILENGHGFQIYQQVAINNKVNLNDLVGIQFTYREPEKSLIKFINKNYPNVEIYFDKTYGERINAYLDETIDRYNKVHTTP